MKKEQRRRTSGSAGLGEPHPTRQRTDAALPAAAAAAPAAAAAAAAAPAASAVAAAASSSSAAAPMATLPRGQLSRIERDAAKILNDALDAKRLFVVVGAGVTLSSVDREAAKSLSWVGLIKSALDYWEEQKPADSNRIGRYRDLIDAGDSMPATQAFKKALSSSDWASWLSSTFGALTATDPSLYEFLSLLQKRGARVITTNYDTLIEKHTGMAVLDPADGTGVNAFFSDAKPQVQPEVFHVHGAWNKPQQVVFDPLDYQKVVAEGSSSGGAYTVQQRMRQLLTTHSVLFIGCGGTLTDPHFTALLEYANELNKDSSNRHVMLMPGLPKPGDPQFLSVQRLNQGTYGELLPSLRNLFPAVQQQQSAAARVEPLSELFAADVSSDAFLSAVVFEISKELQSSPATYPADQAYFADVVRESRVRRVQGSGAPAICRHGIISRQDLQNKYSRAHLEAMDRILAHAKQWDQRDGPIQRLVILHVDERLLHAEDEKKTAFTWPTLYYFLLRCPLRPVAAAAGAGPSSSQSQVFNLAGPLNVNVYIPDEASRQLVERRVFPDYAGDKWDSSAIADYLVSHGVDMEGFDPRSSVSKAMIVKAKEWLRQHCGPARVLSDDNSFQLNQKCCARWRSEVHHSAMKIALVASGYGVAFASRSGADLCLSLRATLKMIAG